MPRIYIAGPMRGYEKFNFPAFDEAEKELTDYGWDVVSPAALDRKAGFDPNTIDDPNYDWRDLKRIGFSLTDAVRRDAEALGTCQAIYMLDGWRDSKGAIAEKAIAEWLGLKVLYENEPDGELKKPLVPFANKFAYKIQVLGGDDDRLYAVCLLARIGLATDGSRTLNKLGIETSPGMSYGQTLQEIERAYYKRIIAELTAPSLKVDPSTVRTGIPIVGQTVTNEQGGKQSFIDARFDCIPPIVLRLLAQCLGFGARKYGKENWKKIPFEDNIAHALNHLNEWNVGDRSEPHLVNAMARISFALWQAVDSGQQPDTYIHPEMQK